MSGRDQNSSVNLHDDGGLSKAPSSGNGQSGPAVDPGSVPLGVGGVAVEPGDHIAHFYQGDPQRFTVLGPYVRAGLERGDRCVFISAPDVAEGLCTWLDAAALDPDTALANDQLVLDQGRATEEEMLRLAETVATSSQRDDVGLVRWAGDGGWALNDKMSVHEMLHWEALYDKHSSAWPMIAMCQFDQAQFSGDVLMDALRSHPYCIMGNVVVPNPEYESPDTLLEEFDS